MQPNDPDGQSDESIEWQWESKSLAEFSGLAEDIARYAARHNILNGLLRGEIFTLSKNKFNQLKFHANYPNPFDHDCDFHLEYQPEHGFFLAFQPDGTEDCVICCIDQKGKVVWLDEYMKFQQETQVVSPERFRLKNTKPTDNLEHIANARADTIVRSFVRYAEPEISSRAPGH
jgi:hypothetical protein